MAIDERDVERSKLPAGLEDTGRDEELEHGDHMDPSGARTDRLASLPGTKVPGGAEPASDEEIERIRELGEDDSGDDDG